MTDALNTACRLVGKADPGEILIDAATRDALGRRFTCEPLGRGTLPLKGLGGVKVYRLQRG